MANFKLAEVDLPALAEGQVLLKNLYMSVDPYMRGWMNENAVYAKPYALNAPMSGGAVSEVVESRDPSLKPGDFVSSFTAWQDFAIAEAKGLQKLAGFDGDNNKLSVYLGALGVPGLTAYVGLTTIGKTKPTDTVFVSAASGAVGLVACQIAKAWGCRVVGSCGSDDKAAFLRDECGVDAVINYKTCGDLTAALKAAAPTGVDVYFENVGGMHLQAALNSMNPHGRIIACGMIGDYNSSSSSGVNNLGLIIGKKLRIEGFIISDHWGTFGEFLGFCAPLLQQGKIKYRETITEGLENAVDSFLSLFVGDNFGKAIVKIA